MFISHLYPQAPLLGLGFSLGANVMTRYLAEEGEKSRLLSGCALGCVSRRILDITTDIDQRRLSIALGFGQKQFRVSHYYTTYSIISLILLAQVDEQLCRKACLL